jgi:hypothetical protein
LAWRLNVRNRAACIERVGVVASGRSLNEASDGVVDLGESQFRPVRGYVEDGSGRLLAVVRRN